MSRQFFFKLLPSLLFASLMFGSVAGAVDTIKPGSCGTDATGATKCVLENPLGTVTNANVLMGKAVAAAMGITGALSLYAFFQGGVTWLRSFGNPEKISKGMHTMLWAVLGLLVVFISYGLVRWMLNVLGTGKAWF